MGVAVGVSYGLVGWIGDAPLWPKVLALCAVTAFAIYLTDLYKTDLRLNGREIIVRLTLAIGCSAITTAALGYAVPLLRLGRLAFFEIFVVMTAGLVVWRLGWDRLRSTQRLSKRVLVVGVSRVADELVALQASGLQPFTVLGFLDKDPAAPDRVPAGTDLLGKPQDLLSLVDELHPDLVLVALPDMRGASPTGDLLECRLRGIRVEDWPTFYEKQTGKVLVTGLRPSWLIFSDGFVKTQLLQTVKRGLDLVLSLVALVLSLPVMALVALAIKLDSPGPALFRQERVGQSGRIFILNKFRSMRVDAEKHSGPVWARAGDPRVTRVGRLLRKTRLDELPQLANVLAGDMSFVGPRPERPDFVRVLQRQIPFYSGRLAVKPGITGWAQVRYQYAASVEDQLEKLQYDLYYIKNLSPFLDLIILLHTIQVVLFARGAR
ncbi:MAG: TIGR03013 family XrtA/PEP-CTERM system glycosyltransferase [Candidatus Rokuibacteriota bacterium]